MTETAEMPQAGPQPGALWRKALGRTHDRLIFSRRVQVLVEALSAHVPQGGTLLDVGTGDGHIARLVADRTGAEVRGIDIMRRPRTHIPVDLFDGAVLPRADASVDAVSFVDVLHHTPDPGALIREAARVAKDAVIIKDHLSENALDHATLRAMDWVGNAPHGVVLPYNYASRAQWLDWFAAAGLEVEAFETRVPLYPFPLSAVFGRGLHFVARLRPVRGK